MATKDPVIDNSNDNIEDDSSTELLSSTPDVAVDVDSDDYLKRFDAVEAAMSNIDRLIVSLQQQPHDEARVRALIECLFAQQKVNEHLYDLLVEMNNFFGKSA